MSASASPTARLPVITNGTVLIHADFLVTGIVMTFLGPMLPHLSTRWLLSDTESGSLIFAEFFSSIFGMLLSGILVQRLGYRFTLMIGLVLMPAGMVLLASGPWILGIAAISILGVGYGITTPAGNLRTAENNPEGSAAALNVINAVWGVGAMSSPFLVDFALRTHQPKLFLFGTAAALLTLLFALSFSRFVPDVRVEEKNSSATRQSAWSMPILPIICALFFIYVGTETSFGNWAAMYARRIAPDHKSLATIAPAFFWGALLLGRATAPIALKKYSETTVARTALSFGVLGGVALVAAHSIHLIVLGCFLAGLGLASIFPIGVALFPRWFGDSARSVSGVVFGSGNIGGAVLPWIVGIVSTRVGDLRWGYVVPLIGASAMLAFFVAQSSPRTETRPDAL
jgi:MFS transporter, FHS family, glucose/mannose:H+ symporter